MQDGSVKRYRAKVILIDPDTRAAIIADGLQLTDDKLSVRIKPRALIIVASK
jgi:hypothetical protein